MRSGVLLALFTCMLASCQPLDGPAYRDHFVAELFVLGIAQDGGMPHLGCERACCTTARKTGRVEYPASLGIVDRASDQLVLVEATPRIEEQVALLHRLAGVKGRGRTPVDAVMVTHAHIGHYLGLAMFGREVVGANKLPIWCSPRFGDYLSSHGPWKQLVELEQLDVHAFTVGKPFRPAPNVSVRAVAVPHRDEFSDTMAYVISGPSKSVLFVPDVDAWERAEGLLERLLQGVDVAYIDGTFFDGSELPERDLNEIRHPLITRTMDKLADVARAHPGRIRFLHLNHTNPALHDESIRAEMRARGFRVAVMGESVGL